MCTAVDDVVAARSEVFSDLVLEFEARVVGTEINAHEVSVMAHQ